MADRSDELTQLALRAVRQPDALRRRPGEPLRSSGTRAVRAPVVEETEVLEGEIESVSCRWCSGGGAVELVARPMAVVGGGS